MMGKFLPIVIFAALALFVGWAAVAGSWAWWVVLAFLLAGLVVGGYDLLQRRHSVLRNYPVIGHMRYLLESIRPELQQYFIERNWDGRPFNRDKRSIIYERAKGIHGEKAYGTERDVNAGGTADRGRSAGP